MSASDSRSPLIAGSVIGFFSVAAGAFGAHALKESLTAELLARLDPGPLLRRAGQGFTLGVVLFTGSLWILALTGQRWLGMVTTLGGISFLFAWSQLGKHVAGIGRETPAHRDEPGPGSS